MGGPCLTRNFFLFGKSSQNSPKPGLIFWSSIPCVNILSVYTLLKVVGYYDLSVLSMSVMGFQRKSLGGWGELYPSVVFDFLNFFNFAKPLTDSCKLCVSRCDQISNRSGLMAWCHHNVGCYIPSEPGVMGRGGRLHVVYYTERHSVGTRVQYVQHNMSCTIQYETERVHRH